MLAQIVLFGRGDPSETPDLAVAMPISMRQDPFELSTQDDQRCGALTDPRWEDRLPASAVTGNRIAPEPREAGQ
ncbi:hypothetical protein FNH05_32850 [Amycolatopsis rhizosphaerae]|uniref:Uncharacterized protein n=1 Tax=Amycolatopsis rhizosphaerae TaxID=2053003 RepID=A0A558AHV8_9PSEU|nr:hypothetical protein [Amycolatopsis rhizosphaerae]TVT23771.1 hypothetical protein FNH05_32850 [Amycolatopsis rhizosphaerae]